MIYIINTENGHILDTYEGTQYSNIERAAHEIKANGYKYTGTEIEGQMVILKVVRESE